MKNRKQKLALVTVATVMLMSGAAAAVNTITASPGTYDECANLAGGEFLVNLTCTGDYCETLSGDCANLNSTLVDSTFDTPTGWFGGDSTSTMECANGWVVAGVRNSSVASGKWFQLTCSEAHDTANNALMHHENCEWSKWISEESWHNQYDVPYSGGSYYDWDWWGQDGNWDSSPYNVGCEALASSWTDSDVTKVITGMECSGTNCDNMRVKCCELATNWVPVVHTTDLLGLWAGNQTLTATAPIEVDKGLIQDFGDAYSYGQNWANYVVIQVVADSGFTAGDTISINNGPDVPLVNTVTTGATNIYRTTVWHPWHDTTTPIEFEIKATPVGATFQLDWWIEPDNDMSRINSL